MPKALRLLNDYALQAIVKSARELPVQERPAFIRIVTHRFVCSNVAPRVLDQRAAQLVTKIDAGNFYTDVNKEKEPLRIHSSNGCWS